MKDVLLICINLVLFTIFSYPSYGQYINAGIALSTDIYTDLTPDDTLLAQAGNHTSYIGGSVQIDIDQNGTNDFEFIAYAFGALGGGSTYCGIHPLSTNNKILARPDTSIGYSGTQYIKNVPLSLNYDDSILISANFNNGFNYLWSSTYGYESAPNINDWNNIGDSYIGVSLDVGNDTLIGWIRVNVSYINYIYKLTIKDFACNNNPNSIINIENTSQINIFPNPVKNNLKIDLPDNIRINHLSLFSINEQILFQKTQLFNFTSIDLSEIKSGIYILKIETENNTIVKKIIKE